MKIKQTIKKIEEEIEEIKSSLKGLNERYHSEKEDEDIIWKDQKKNIKDWDKRINQILGTTGSWDNWAACSDEFLTYLLKEKLSGYKLALKDVLSEIDNFKFPCCVSETEECHKTQKAKEELKKPIQEILKEK